MLEDIGIAFVAVSLVYLMLAVNDWINRPTVHI